MPEVTELAKYMKRDIRAIYIKLKKDTKIM